MSGTSPSFSGSSAALADPVVHARNWGWRHPGRLDWAVRGIDLDINPGQVVLIVGGSGAGKSTLLHGIAGVLEPEEGESQGDLTIGGYASSSPHVRGRVGLVQQDPESQRVMGRIGDEVAFGLENLGVRREQIWPRVRDALDTVGLDLPLSHPTSHLSGGQKQRLALACALAMSPQVILLDEPTANLDEDGAREMREAAVKLAHSTGATLIVVDHNLAPWLPDADQLVVLDRGGVVAAGSPDEILASHGALLRKAGVWTPGLDPLEFLPLSDGSARHHIDTVVSTTDLSVGYEDGTPVLHDLNLNFKQSRSTCITGPNGAGKTTLALTLAGLLPPKGGAVEAAENLITKQPSALGNDPFQWTPAELLGKISMVFQEPQYQFVTGTVAEELSLGPRLAGLDEQQVQAQVDRFVRLLHLEHLREAHPLSLSGGERRRLGVGTALIAAPEVVVLDEPTFGQDFNTWIDLVTVLLAAKAQGTTLITVTHDPHLMRALGDEVLQVGAQQAAALPPQASSEPAKPSVLSRVNPATQILALLVMTLPLLVTIDPVSAGVALFLELLLLPLAGLRPRQVLLRLAPLFVAAPLAALSMLLYATPGGQVYAQWGPAAITENSVLMASSIALRVLAVGLPAVIILPSLGSTEVSDSLTQILRLPSRFVLSSLAAVRMVGLMLSDWQALRRARRSRGMKGTNFARSAFSLVTFALRRADSLSVSMEARGFGANIPRSNARVSTLSRADVLMLAVALTVPTVALATARFFNTFSWFGLG